MLMQSLLMITIYFTVHFRGRQLLRDMWPSVPCSPVNMALNVWREGLGRVSSARLSPLHLLHLLMQQNPEWFDILMLLTQLPT